MNPYSILGIAPNASDVEIKNAYRKKAKEFHPDLNKNADAKEKFQQVQQAYDTLTQKPQQHNTNFHDNIHDMMNAFVHQMRRDSFAQQLNVNIQVELTLEQVFFGKKKCKVSYIKVTNNVQTLVEEEFDVPAGVTEGTRIQFKNKGHTAQGMTGNLTVYISITPHNDFELHNNDLYTLIKINALSAITGTTKRIKTIDGKEIDVEIKAGVQNDSKIRVSGFGMNRLRESGRGDLYCIVNVTTDILPEHLLTELKKWTKDSGI